MISLSTRNIDYTGWRPIPKTMVIRHIDLIEIYNTRHFVNVLAQRVLVIGGRVIVGQYAEY